jgi:hypothetical protein
VANQSVKLKLVGGSERAKGDEQAAAKIKEAIENVGSHRGDATAEAAKKAAFESAEKYTWMPLLSFDVTKMEHNGGCIGMLSAKAEAALRRSAMISTGTSIAFPWVTIWSESELLAGPPSSFARFVIQTSEEMMKRFVNDWSRSQE